MQVLSYFLSYVLNVCVCVLCFLRFLFVTRISYCYYLSCLLSCQITTNIALLIAAHCTRHACAMCNVHAFSDTTH